MKKLIRLIPLVVIAGCISAGCGIGDPPSAMSNQDARNALDKLSPQDKIRYYSGSPMSQADKEKHYKEIEAQTGVKASDVLGNAPTQPGNPSR